MSSLTGDVLMLHLYPAVYIKTGVLVKFPRNKLTVSAGEVDWLLSPDNTILLDLYIITPYYGFCHG